MHRQPNQKMHCWGQWYSSFHSGNKGQSHLEHIHGLHCFHSVMQNKGQSGLIGQQGTSLYEKGPQKAQKWPYLNDSRLSSKQCFYFSGKTKGAQSRHLPWLCVWAGLSLTAVTSALWTCEPACPHTVLLQLLLGHQLSWTLRPLGRVLSLGAGLWISLILVVLQATLSRLAHHQSSFSLPGPGEAPILICFRATSFYLGAFGRYLVWRRDDHSLICDLLRCWWQCLNLPNTVMKLQEMHLSKKPSHARTFVWMLCSDRKK